MADRSKGFFTETASMPTLTYPSSSEADWGFRVGVGLVALIAVAQILSVGYYYVGHNRVARAATQPAVAVTAPTPAPALPTAPPSTPAAAPSVAAAASPAVAAASPPAPSVAPADRLLQEATALRERGDNANAIARLQEATQRDPKNAAVLAEMASVYESMQLYDRSNETWRKVEEIGPSAGAFYDQAESKLKLGASAPAVANAAPAVTPATMPSAPPVEQTAAAPRTTTQAPAEGAVLDIGEIQVTEAPDYDAETNLTVRIPIKARAGAIIDHTKVTIRVYFYDTIGDDAKPVLTDAQTNFEWLTPNHDWAGPNPEVLAVNYFRPKNASASSDAALSAAAANVVPGKKPRTTSAKTGAGAGARRYLGYIVRIYYNDKLQAQRGQPTQLLAIYPAGSSSQ